MALTNTSGSRRRKSLYWLAAGQRSQKPRPHDVLASPGGQRGQASERSSFGSNNTLRAFVIVVLQHRVQGVRAREVVCERAPPCVWACDQIVESLRHKSDRGEVCRGEMRQGVCQDLFIALACYDSCQIELDKPFGKFCIGLRWSPGLLGFLITSNAGPSLFLTGGVEAFSYSVILFLPTGGEGVSLAFSLLSDTSPSCSRSSAGV